jgi:hypothetical protein
MSMSKDYPAHNPPPEDEVLKLLMRVKPTAEMPRQGARKPTPKDKARTKRAK